MEELPYGNLLQNVKCFISNTATAREKSYPISEYRKMSLDDLRTSDSSGRGTRLIKFFPDMRKSDGRNYSEEALRNQTVYLADPKVFNDPFDCVIGYNQTKTMYSLLSKMVAEFGIEISEYEDLADYEQQLTGQL